MSKSIHISIGLLLLILLTLLGSTTLSGQIRGPIIQLTIEDVIGPATDDYIERALETAAEEQAELVAAHQATILVLAVWREIGR